MKKYLSFSILILFQLFMFYIFPLFCGPTDVMGMVLLIIIVTFILSFISAFFNIKLKYTYPLIIAILFIPSVFIYYNESALVHTIWYLVISTIGLLFGLLSNLLINKKER